MANELKRKRREELGDTPLGERIISNDSTSGIPPQPMPGMPQGQGNMMNNPQVGMSMGNGMPQPGRLDPYNPQSPYGDAVFSNDQYRQTGTPGFSNNSGQFQSLVPGTGLNAAAYNSVAQPKPDTIRMLDVIGISQEAVSRAQKLYAASGDPAPSYQIGPLGMAGQSIEDVLKGGPLTPVQLSSELSGNSTNTLAMQGLTTQSIANGDPNSLGTGNTGSRGTNLGRGGGRNQIGLGK